jgi:cbb3-type cytochrome oxidase subunit 3
VFDNARTKVRNGLAVFAFFSALVGGLFASVSMIGGWLSGIANIGPWWMPWVCFAVSFMVCLYDWAEGDATPNRRATYTAMMWPSFLVAALTGESGAKFFGSIGAIGGKETGKKWAAAVKGWTELAGDMESAFTVFSIIFLIFGVVYAQQFAKKKKAAAAAASSAATPVGARRGGR